MEIVVSESAQATKDLGKSSTVLKDESATEKFPHGKSPFFVVRLSVANNGETSTVTCDEKRSATRRVGEFILAAFVMLLPWLGTDWGEEGSSAFSPLGAWREPVSHLLAVLLLALGLRLRWRENSPRRDDTSQNRILSPAFASQPFARNFGWLSLALPCGFIFWAALSWYWTADTLATRMWLYSAVPWTGLVVAVILFTQNPPQNQTADAKGSGAALRAWLLRLLCLSGVLVACATLAVWEWNRLFGTEFFVHPTHRLAFPFEHPAALGGSLALPTTVLLLVTTHALLHKHFRRAGWLTLAVLPCVMALLLCRTRSSIVGVLVGVWLGGLLLTRERARKFILWGGLILGCVVIITAVTHFADPHHREEIYTGSFGTRVIFGGTALRMAEASPLAGFGAGAFCRNAGKFEKPTDFLQGQRGDIVYTTHSEPLQILAELGLVGCFLWLLMHGLPLWRVWRNSSSVSMSSLSTELPPQTFRRLTASLTLAGLTAMFIDSCGSMSLRYAELPWLYAVGLGLALGCLREESKDCRETELLVREDPPKGGGQSTTRIIPALLLVVVILGGGVWLARVTRPGARAEWQLNKAESLPLSAHKRAGRLAREASGNARRMLTWWRSIQAAAYLDLQNGDLQHAVELRRKIMVHFPSDPVNRQQLLRLLFRLGRTEEALRTCLGGLKIDPHNRELDTWLGILLRGSELSQVRRWTGRMADILTATDRRYLEWRTEWEAAGSDGQTSRREAIAGLRSLDRTQITIGRGDLKLAQWLRQDLLHLPLSAARAARITRQRKEIIALLEPLAKAIPANPRALALLAEILVLHGDGAASTRAFGLIARAVRLDRLDPAVIGVAAPMYIATRDSEYYRQAAAITRVAVRQNPEDASLRVIRIETLLRLGKRKEAAAAWREASRRFPYRSRLRSLGLRQNLGKL